MSDPAAACPLCRPAGEQVLWRDGSCRVILAAEADHPATCRVVWHEHVGEMSDLEPAARARLLEVVVAVEQALRRLLGPDKVNLASLGNQVPHLHWHVVPRFADDAHFPDAVWAPRRRAGVARRADPQMLRAELARRLGGPAGA